MTWSTNSNPTIVLLHHKPWTILSIHNAHEAHKIKDSRRGFAFSLKMFLHQSIQTFCIQYDANFLSRKTEISSQLEVTKNWPITSNTIIILTKTYMFDMQFFKIWKILLRFHACIIILNKQCIRIFNSYSNVIK